MEEEEEKAVILRHAQAWVTHGLKLAVDLVKLDDQNRPLAGACSGFLIKRNGRNYVLSAGHGLGEGNWFLQTNVADHTAAKSVLVPMNGVFSLKRIQDPFGDNPTVKPVDFAWCEVLLDPLLEEMKKKPYLIQDKPFFFYDGRLDTTPLPDTPYNYAAHNNSTYYDAFRSYREQSETYETFMEYDGIDESRGLYRFKLSRSHQGNAYYEGASGSPIFDPDGTIVSMVLRGKNGEDFMYGLPLTHYEACVGLETPSPK